MKTNLLICFLSITSLIFGQRDREIVKQTDNVNPSELIYSHNDLEKPNQEIIAKSKFPNKDYKLSDMESLQQLEAVNRLKMVNLILSVTLLVLVLALIIMYLSYKSKGKLIETLNTRNAELEIAKNQALKLSEHKSRFISHVSHELRTPLYGVVGIASLLLNNNNLSYRDRKLLQSLKFSGDYLLNLINDILQVSKMESQKVELKNVSVNLKFLMQSIVDSFEYRLQETNNKINVTIDNHVPEHIKCDNVRLSQVLINLIGNSVKFTESGIIDLRVRLISLETDKVGLRFEVEDNGIGIPKEKFDSIFDNFSQLEDENAINYQGTGLGLSITKKLIELFNSKIELESEVGKGTRFSFNVDFEIDTTVNATRQAIKNFNNKVLPTTKAYKILVAEDNKINQIVTKNLLIKENYVCTIVQNGQEIMEEINRNEFDLILMDIHMPIMNGNEATKAIRQFNTTIPIIALTASDIEEVRGEYKNIGYNDIITKPFDNYEFFQVIANNIQNSQRALVKAS